MKELTKELSIEEKAKRYDEALASAKNTIEVNQTIPDIVDCIKSLFPELAETDDERIRKEIEIILANTDLSQFALDYTFADMLEYLEKQGKKKSLDDVVKEITKNKKTAISFLKSCGIMNANGELADEYKIEQDVMNPTDNIEPKFKAGDKVIADGKIYTIKLVNEDNYIVDENGRDVQEHFSYTKDWKLYEQNPTYNVEPKFNVGDIISDGISEVEIVSIDKENKYYNVTNSEIENDAHICNWVIYFKDQEKWKLVKYKSYNKENKEHSQLKQEWSDEDKRNYLILQKIICDTGISAKMANKLSDWLESLKERIQPKVELNKDDEHYYGIIQYILNNECVGKTDRESAINWFKSLKERYIWKPSERQISALEWQLKNTYEGSWQYIETKKLLEQLKRLM